MNKDLDERLSKVLYNFFKIKHEKASKIQKQFKVYRFRKTILKGLKVFRQRKKLWIKFAQQQKKKLLMDGLTKIRKFAEYKDQLKKESMNSLSKQSQLNMIQKDLVRSKESQAKLANENLVGKKQN